MFKNIPLTKAQPNAARFVDTLMGRAPAPKPPLVEYIVVDSVRKPIVTELLGREWVNVSADRADQEAYLDNMIAFWQGMGYDFVRFELSLPFQVTALMADDTAEVPDAKRAWADEHRGSIQTWEDFENYPWPKVEAFDFHWFEYVNSHLPEGMGLISSHGGGPFEFLSRLFSVEGMCIAVYENPELVKAVADRIGGLMVKFYEHLLGLDRLIVVFPGDDMGFRTGTMIPPHLLSDLTLPWHKKFAAMAHERGLPYFLHSCGCLTDIMEELIEGVRIDGKHSYENAIIPAPDFQKRYGDRIAILGGIDVDILAGDSPAEVRRKTRALIDECGPRGRFAIGSGNSIPSYVSVENYLTMIDEAQA